MQLIREGLQRIHSNQGSIPIKQLASGLNVSTKTLERKFSALVGKTPKQYMNILRFHRIIQQMGKGVSKNLTDFAFDNGYYDQSHFIHNFKNFTGYSPREFVKQLPYRPEYE